ncbi:MAG: hypothetical protein KKD18_03215 [Nanoarchaeota archaeon]|nr:hypothetical protein [Nanoarchaeota archaeon]MBU0977399.1 hypothetical protein [Nanoarchaeota archaeon]
MLNQELVRKIENFVYAQPRSIQEVAVHIKKNWRTTDRYLQEIEKELGTVSSKVFRGGTRGALKIVYWTAVEKISHSVFQEQLEKEIMSGKDKSSFSAFDIFQHVADKDKRAIIEDAIDENSTNLEELKELLDGAQKEVLLFSGDMSFINLRNKNFNMEKILEDLVDKGISVKIICRVDLVGKRNIEKTLAINYKKGKEVIEIRHRVQPLRAVLVDKKYIRLKEVKEPTGKIGELDKKIFIFYTLKDREWASWMHKIFWKMFSSSIGVDKRLKEVEKLKEKT